jgi:hypothetical protein
MSPSPKTATSGPSQTDLDAARKTLQEAGYSVRDPREGIDPTTQDPFASMDVETIPQAALDNAGISREELRRHRAAPPAVEHGYHEGDPAAPALEGPTGP